MAFRQFWFEGGPGKVEWGPGNVQSAKLLNSRGGVRGGFQKCIYLSSTIMGSVV